MALDLNSLLLGLGAAALPLLGLLWHLQRRLAARQAESALLDERLSMAQMAQEGLNAQLDACRDEVSDLSQANAAKQADLAALRREVELLRQESDNARETAQDWNHERAAREAELRRLDAQCAALNAELREQQDGHQQRLNDLQGSGMSCARSSLNWRARFSMSASSASPRPASSSWANCSLRSRSVSSRSKSVSRRVTRTKRANAFPWPRSWNVCSS